MFNSINELDILNVSPKALQQIAVVQFIFKITTRDQAQLSALVSPQNKYPLEAAHSSKLSNCIIKLNPPLKLQSFAFVPNVSHITTYGSN